MNDETRNKTSKLMGDAFRQCKTKMDVMVFVLAVIHFMLQEVANDETEKERMRTYICLKMLEM